MSAGKVSFMLGKHMSVGANGSHGIFFKVLEKLEPIASQNVKATPTTPPVSVP